MVIGWYEDPMSYEPGFTNDPDPRRTARMERRRDARLVLICLGLLVVTCVAIALAGVLLVP